MGLSAADAPAGGGACKNSVTRAATCRRVNSCTEQGIDECERV